MGQSPNNQNRKKMTSKGDKQTPLRKWIIPIRGFMGFCHILIDKSKESAIVIDTGLFGEFWAIKLALKAHRILPSKVEAILLTHGHLDHSGNLSFLKNYTNAPVYAHLYDQNIINGTNDYKGTNVWCGRLEAMGRKLLGVGLPVDIDHQINDGDKLPFLGGIEVIHLPGHTHGHCGFHLKESDAFFTGDLFSSYPLISHLPAPILNSNPSLLTSSMKKAIDVNAEYIIPQHYDFFWPRIHKKRMLEIYQKMVKK